MFDSAVPCEVARFRDKPGDGKSVFRRLTAQDLEAWAPAEGTAAELGQGFRLSLGSGEKIRC